MDKMVSMGHSSYGTPSTSISMVNRREDSWSGTETDWLKRDPKLILGDLSHDIPGSPDNWVLP